MTKARSTKPIQGTQSETKPKHGKIQTTKAQNGNYEENGFSLGYCQLTAENCQLCFEHLDFVFWICFGFRASDFGFARSVVIK